MANKIRTPINDEVSVPATIHTANLAKGTFVKIVGDATVDVYDTEDEICVGFVVKPARDADGKGSIQTRYDYLIDMQCDDAIAAGDRIKMGESVGGVQTVAKWTRGTDNPELVVGICWIGAADTATGTFLFD